MNAASATGSSANNRKSRMMKSNPMPAQAPTQAFRLSVAASAATNAGMLADHGQRLDEAIDLVQRALKIEPTNPSFLDSLGWAYFRQGKLELADPPLTQAAERLPTSSAVNEHLGDLRFKQERYDDAVAAFERSLAGDGESIDRAKIEKKVRDARQRVKR